MTDPLLQSLVPVLSGVGGIEAVVLGGSRSRGDALPSSDYDLGLYFRTERPIDVGGLRQAMEPLIDPGAEATITAIGEWGPWIVGGGWLTIGGQAVDLLYRNVDAVSATIDRAVAGTITVDYQPGHPHGFVSTIWLAEVHHCRTLHDPAGTVADLKRRLQPFPHRLALALVDRFQWEIGFAAAGAAKAIARDDRSYIAGLIFRTLACAAQVICAINGRYVMNEKGALALAGGLPLTPPDLGARIDALWDRFAERDHAGAIERLVMIERDVAGLVDEWRRTDGNPTLS